MEEEEEEGGGAEEEGMGGAARRDAPPMGTSFDDIPPAPPPSDERPAARRATGGPPRPVGRAARATARAVWAFLGAQVGGGLGWERVGRAAMNCCQGEGPCEHLGVSLFFRIWVQGAIVCPNLNSNPKPKPWALAKPGVLYAGGFCMH